MGKSHGKEVAVKALGVWKPKRRNRAALQVLRKADHGRVRALLPLKLERMAGSPFGFFRGAAALMAYDLSLGQRTSIVNQLCGDAHVQNLGAYEGIDGKLIFDVNDFDETTRGPFEWDLKRMATSVLVAGTQAKVSTANCNVAAQAFLDAYCATMQILARLPVLDVARYQVRRLNAAPAIARILQDAERASPIRLWEKLTEEGSDGRVFRQHKPVLWRVHGKVRRAVVACLDEYRESLLPERRHFFDQFTTRDIAFKVVGTGSVGLRDYCVYMQGNGAGDPLFLQVKEEAPSAYAPYLPQGAGKLQQGKRVADGQRAMQLQSDPLLGWTRMGKRDYLVRQLNDHKASLDVTLLDAAGLAEYAAVCGEMLARGHARSGNASLIAGYVGDGNAFGEAILHFAKAYAQQTTLDWKALLATI